MKGQYPKWLSFESRKQEHPLHNNEVNQGWPERNGRNCKEFWKDKTFSCDRSDTEDGLKYG
jgi:hypothetical protein